MAIESKSHRLSEQFIVKSVDTEIIQEWYVKRHYIGKSPTNSLYSFALYDTCNKMVGVMSIGFSAAMGTNTLLGDSYRTLELTRLIINEGLPKNTASYFMGKAFSLLPKPLAIISYADASVGHHGYIYQATNFLFIGCTDSRVFFVKDGIEYHPKTIYNLYGTSSYKDERLINDGYEVIRKPSKYRYILFLGKKRDVKQMREIILSKGYKILPYPKGDNQRYDSKAELNVQMSLL